MGTYTVYRLKFKTQLHLGRATGAAQTGSLGLEKTETYISADTLFSATLSNCGQPFMTPQASPIFSIHTQQKTGRYPSR